MAAAAVQSVTVALGWDPCGTAHTQVPFPVLEVGRHKGRELCW